jgi:multidrug resistance efflux pump
MGAKHSMGKRIRRLIPFLLILTFLGISLTALNQMMEGEDHQLVTSGTIELEEVMLSFEMGGRIDQVLIEEGDLVRSGDVLARLDDGMLQAQLTHAEAALRMAQANMVLVAEQSLTEQREAATAKARLELLEAQQALDDLIESAELDRAEAEQALEDAEQAFEDMLDSDVQQKLALRAFTQAEKDLDEAERKLTILSKTPTQAVIDQAFANMLLAREAKNQTWEDIETARRKLKSGLGPFYPQELNEKYKKQLRVAIRNLEAKYSRDQLAYENSVEKYNQLLNPPDPVDLALAEADLAMAEARLGQTRREFERVKDGPGQADIAVMEARIASARREVQTLSSGPDPDDLAAAKARINQAKAELSLADTDTAHEQLEIARVQVEAARAALNIIQIHRDKAMLTAPISGVVLRCTFEPGEVIKPGADGITIGLLDKLHITIYLPESMYGNIQHSEWVQVMVESYPDETFIGRITSIASESQFIPRNVLQADGGRELVFPVTISLKGTNRLKPGMDAQVIFQDL